MTLVNVRVGIYAEKRLLLNDSMVPAAFKALAAANVVSRQAMRPGQTIAGEVIICEPGDIFFWKKHQGNLEKALI